MSIYDPNVLAGKRILITGGGTGLGRGVAGHLVKHGAEVHLWGRRLQRARGGRGGDRRRARYVQTVDVRDADAVDAAVGEIWAEHGPLTGLINNAAANFIAPTKNISRARVHRDLLDGDERLVQHDARGRQALDRGGAAGVGRVDADVVGVDRLRVRRAVGDGQGRRARDDDVAGRRVGPLRHPPERDRRRPDPDRLRVGDAQPDVQESSVGATQADQVPLQRFGTVEELANLNIFLLSDACDYLTGHTIAMDGGQHLAGPGTFAGLTSLSDDDWAEIRAQSQAASEAAKAQRTT